MVSLGLVATTNPAVYGLLGSLIGGFIAGSVSLLVAWQTRAASERAWVRDNRRGIYDRFLTAAQRLLIAAERAAAGKPAALDTAYEGFFETWGVVQTVSERAVVDAARDYVYGLQHLHSEVEGGLRRGLTHFEHAAKEVQEERRNTIDAMRKELGLEGSARPGSS
jgi:hypothetical protein